MAARIYYSCSTIVINDVGLQAVTGITYSRGNNAIINNGSGEALLNTFFFR